VSKKQVPVADALMSREDMGVWQRNLFARTLRMITAATFPVVLLALYYVYVTQALWLTPVILGAYSVIIIGAFVPQIPYPLRVWAFLAVLLGLGLGDLLTYGWGRDVRIYWLGAMLFATLFLGGRHGLGVLIGICVVLGLFVVGIVTGVFVPPLYPTAAYPHFSLLVGLVIFVAVTIGLYASFNYLVPRLLTALQKSAALSISLEEQQAVLAERTRTLQEANTNLQRRAMFLEASTQVSQALATVFEAEILLEQAVNLIVQHFDFYRAAIFLTDDEGQSVQLHAAASIGGRRMTMRSQRWRVGDLNAVGMVLANQEPCIVTKGRRNVAYATEVDLAVVRSEAALPLMVGSRLIGVLDVYSGEEVIFDQDDVHALQGLAGLLSVAVDNARRLGDEAAVLEAASPLYRLAHQLATTRTEREIYAAMLGALRDFNPARVFIFRQSRLPNSHTPPAEQAYLVAEMRGGDMSFYEQYITAAAIHHIGDLINFGAMLESSLVIGDLSMPYHSGSADVDRLLSNLAAELGVLALTLAPMRMESQCLGVVLITYNTPHQFTPLQGQLQRVLTNLATVALERIRLLHEAQTRVGRERWLREFGEQVLRIPDLETMVAQSAQLLQDAVQAESVLVSLAPPGEG